MKITITYDKSKDKFYFDFDDKTLETFYGFFAAKNYVDFYIMNLQWLKVF